MNLGRENEITEFKESTAEIDSSLCDMVAMLNKNQEGKVYFGVRDNGEVKGHIIGNSTTKDITNKIYQKIKPIPHLTINILNSDNMEYIEVTLKGREIPYTVKGVAYIRIGDESREGTSMQIKDMYTLSDSSPTWENMPSGSLISDVDEDILKYNIQQGYKKARIPYDFESVQISLNKLGLLKEGFLTNAGNILFSTIGPIWVRMAIFATEDKNTILETTQIRGNIYECIDKTMKFITTNIKWGAKFGEIKRDDIPEIPINGLREIVVNSFVHASYMNTSAYHEIFIFPNSVSIFNPGRLLPGIDPKIFAKGESVSLFRNPKICEVMYKTGEVETYGSGFRRAFDEFSKLGVRYEYVDSAHGFNFKIFRKGYAPSTKIYDSNLSTSEKKILEIIIQYPDATLGEIASRINKSGKTTYTNILRLEKANYVRRSGSINSGTWRVLE